MALEVELRKHRELHHILMSLYTQLHNQFVQYQGRLVSYKVMFIPVIVLNMRIQNLY